MPNALSRLNLRCAEKHDAWDVWSWANDPLTRSVSFSSGVIPWEEHCAWFAQRLSDPACVFLIADLDQVPAGQIRFEVLGSDATVSVGLGANVQGRGLGTEVIRQGTAFVFGHVTSLSRVVAYIKSENLASIRAFDKAGYMEGGFSMVKGHRAVRMLFSRSEA